MLYKAHQGMAYLITLFGFVNVALALSVARNPAGLAKIMIWTHRVVLMGGRLSLLLGISLLVVRDMGFHPIAHWWAWSSLLLWGGVEMASKRLVSPELDFARDGVDPSNKLLMGLSIELLIIGAIFGMMFLK